MALNQFRRGESLELVEMYIENKEEFDISQMFVGCSIFEDIFSPFLTGNLILIDHKNFINKIPIDGWQKLVITFKTTSKGPFSTFSKTFRITKLERLENDDNGRMARYMVLHFVSDSVKKNFEKRISRAYKEMKESEIVNDVVTNILGSSVEVEKTKYKKTIVVPNWQPKELIDYCCRTAIRGSGYESANYVFFEDLKKFNFISIDKIIESEPNEPKLTSHIAATQMTPEGAESSFRQVDNYVTRVNFDFLKNSDNGMWGTRFFGVDITSKKWKVFDWIYDSEFDSMPKIDGSNDKLTNNSMTFPEQLMKVGPYQTKPRKINSDWNSKHAHKRTGMMQIFDNHFFEAEISGDSTLSAGQKIQFDMPDKDEDNNTGKLDEKFSGMYIITQVHHMFNTTEHRQVLGLRKPHPKKV